MARLVTLALALRSDEEAATIVEYTLMMVLVALSCAAAVSTFGSAVAGLFQKAVNAFPH